MKKILFVLLLLPFILNSCTYVGYDPKEQTSTYLNDSGYILSKTPIEFDRKFGYAVMVIKPNDTLNTSISYTKIFIPEKIYQKIPEPKDGIKIKIYFLKEIEYGETKYTTFFWDFRFNLGYDFIVEDK